MPAPISHWGTKRIAPLRRGRSQVGEACCFPPAVNGFANDKASDRFQPLADARRHACSGSAPNRLAVIPASAGTPAQSTKVFKRRKPEILGQITPVRLTRIPVRRDAG